MRRTSHLIAALALAASLPAALSAAELTVKGSDTMVIMAQKWAEQYMKEQPSVAVQVTGGGSGTGIAALLNNTTDLAIASRPMKPKEIADFVVKFTKKPVETKTALDGLAVYVNEQNPVRQLSIPQLDRIFRGEIKNWKEVGGQDQSINLYSRENNSGTYAYFKEHVLKDKDFAVTAQNMAGTAALINAIAKDKNAIGYGGIAYAKGAVAIGVKADEKSPAILPEMDKVVSGEYPISRYLFLYSNPENKKPEVRQFIDWIVGSTGQKIVAEVGYFPLPNAPAIAVPSTPAASATPEPAPASGQIAAAASEPAQPPPATVSKFNPNAPEILKLSERESAIAHREQAVAEREATVAFREMRLAEREAQIAQREVTLSEKLASAPEPRSSKRR